MAERGQLRPRPQVAGLCISGQLSQWNGERRFIGKVGRVISVEEGRHAARLCALILVAQARHALNGDLDRMRRRIRVAGYVNSAPEFSGQSHLINGAADLSFQAFGESGRHTRMAVGVAALPYGVAVEVEAVLEFCWVSQNLRGQTVSGPAACLPG
jgi:enamine deaminase RidA (YjgF/YER057c/UK114 family)